MLNPGRRIRPAVQIGVSPSPHFSCVIGIEAPTSPLPSLYAYAAVAVVIVGGAPMFLV